MPKPATTQRPRRLLRVLLAAVALVLVVALSVLAWWLFHQTELGWRGVGAVLYRNPETVRRQLVKRLPDTPEGAFRISRPTPEQLLVAVDLGGRRDFADLGRLRSLPITNLDVHDTPVTSLRALRSMRLRVLRLDGCAAVESFAPLYQCPELQTLIAPGAMTDLELLTPMADLRRVTWVQGMPLSRHRSLAIERDRLTDRHANGPARWDGVAAVWSALDGRDLAYVLTASADGLELDLSANRGLADVSFLAGLPLSSLDLHGTKVGDLAPLAGMPLTCIDLTAVPVRDVADLAGMPLQLVFLDGCLSLSDLSWLRDCGDLAVLSMPASAQNVDILRDHRNLRLVYRNPSLVRDPGDVPRQWQKAGDLWQSLDAELLAAGLIHPRVTPRPGAWLGNPDSGADVAALAVAWQPVDAGIAPESAKRTQLLFSWLQTWIFEHGWPDSPDTLCEQLARRLESEDGCLPRPVAVRLPARAIRRAAARESLAAADAVHPVPDWEGVCAEASARYPCYQTDQVIRVRYLWGPHSPGWVTGEFRYVDRNHVMVGRSLLKQKLIMDMTEDLQVRLNPPLANQKREEYTRQFWRQFARRRGEYRDQAFREAMAHYAAENEKSGYILFAGRWCTSSEVLRQMLDIVAAQTSDDPAAATAAEAP